MTPPLTAQSLERLMGDPLENGHPFSFESLMALDEREEFPSRQVEILDQAGLNAHFVPADLGGRLTDFEDVFSLLTTLSRRDLTVAIGKFKTLLGALPVWIGGTPAQQTELARRILADEDVSLALTEKNHGSDLLAGETRAESFHKGYRLTGEKWLINNATRSQSLCVLARTKAGSDPRGFSFFLFHKDRSSRHEPLPKIRTLGIRGADISGIRFDGSEIPETDVIGGHEGKAFEQLMKTFQISRTLCAALSLGAADSGFRLVYDFIRERRMYGGGLLEKPVIADAFPGLLTRMWVCEAMTRAAIRSFRMEPKALGILSSAVKYFVPTESERLLRELSVLLGARHYLRETYACGVFQKIERDHALVPLFDGSTQVNLQNVFSLMSPRIEPAPVLFGDGFQSADFSFAQLTVQRAAADPWLGVFASLASNEDPVIASAARAFEEERRRLDDELGDLGAAARWSTEAFAVAERRCRLFAAAATLIFFSQEKTALPPTWIHLALSGLLTDSRLADTTSPSIRARARKELQGHIEDRARRGLSFGLFPMALASSHQGRTP